MKRFLKTILGDKAGAAAAEYALILAVVGGGIILAMTNLGGAIKDKIDTTTDAIEGVKNP